MTPTSATGKASPVGAQAASRRAASVSATKRRAGFTLVELMMTVAIMGLAAGAVVMTLPDPQPSVSEAADVFAARLMRAREEAVLANRPTAVEVTRAGYAFAAFDGARWSPLNEGPFRARPWDEAVSVDVDQPLRIVFDPTGAAEPTRVTLSRDGRNRSVVVDGAGEVSIRD